MSSNELKRFMDDAETNAELKAGVVNLKKMDEVVNYLKTKGYSVAPEDIEILLNAYNDPQVMSELADEDMAQVVGGAGTFEDIGKTIGQFLDKLCGTERKSKWQKAKDYFFK